jgi:hypothetical protein
MRRYCVVVAAGDTSLHDTCKWFDADRSYDLCVAYFGGNDAIAAKYKRESDSFFPVQGPKWPIIRAVMTGLDLTQYQYVWLPDDDLEVSPDDINRMFQTAAKYRSVWWRRRLWCC